MVIHKADIRDLFELTKFLEEYIEVDNLIMRVRSLLYYPSYNFYITEGIVIVLEENKDNSFSLHPYVHKDYRGKQFLQALKALEEHLKETNSPIKKVRMEFREGDRQTKMLVRFYPGKVHKVNERVYEYYISACNAEEE